MQSANQRHLAISRLLKLHTLEILRAHHALNLPNPKFCSLKFFSYLVKSMKLEYDPKKRVFRIHASENEKKDIVLGKTPETHEIGGKTVLLLAC